MMAVFVLCFVFGAHSSPYKTKGALLAIILPKLKVHVMITDPNKIVVIGTIEIINPKITINTILLFLLLQ